MAGTLASMFGSFPGTQGFSTTLYHRISQIDLATDAVLWTWFEFVPGFWTKPIPGEAWGFCRASVTLNSCCCGNAAIRTWAFSVLFTHVASLGGWRVLVYKQKSRTSPFLQKPNVSALKCSFKISRTSSSIFFLDWCCSYMPVTSQTGRMTQ